jgi:hypothetical protein
MKLTVWALPLLPLPIVHTRPRVGSAAIALTPDVTLTVLTA